MDDEKARLLASLVERYYRLLYRFAYRLSGSEADAEDLTQQTFLTAQRKIDQLRDVASARSWLCTILRNLFLKQLRSRPSAVPVPLEHVPEPETSPPSADDIDTERLQQALCELPEAFRTPLVLFYFREFSYREIAEIMGVPVGTVMSRLARAKGHLRRRLSAATASSTSARLE